MSPEFQLYLDYVRKLSFTERPDYELLKGMFREVCFFFFSSLWDMDCGLFSFQAMGEKHLENDGVFDWLNMSRDSDD